MYCCFRNIVRFKNIVYFLLLYQYGVECKQLPSMFGSDDFEEKINKIDIIDKNEVLSVQNDDKRQLIKHEKKCPTTTICDIYLMRFLNKLLTMANLKDEDYGYPENSIVSLNLHVKSKSIRVIKSFAKGKNNIYTWHELDAAFADLLAIKNEEFEMPVLNKPVNPTYSKSTKSPEFIITTVISCFVLMAFWLILKGVSLKRTLLLIIVSAFAIGLATTWLNDVEEKRIESIITISRNENIPEDCVTHELSWWRYIFPSRKNECKDYHWAHVDPMSRVVFTEVLTKTLVNMFAVPLPILGDALGKMTFSFTHNLPWASSALMNSITIPFLFPIIGCFMILIGCIIFCGPGLIFSTPFGSITSKDPQYPQQPQQPQNLEYRQEDRERTKKYLKLPSRRTSQVEYVSKRHIPVQKSQSEVFIKVKEDKRPKLMRHKSEIAPNYVKQKSISQNLVEFVKPKPKRQKIVIVKDSDSEESFYEEVIVPSKRKTPVEESGYSVIYHDELSDHSDIVTVPETDGDDILSTD